MRVRVRVAAPTSRGVTACPGRLRGRLQISANQGIPVIMDEKSDAGQAYSDAVERLLGKDIPHRFLEAQKKGLLQRLFGGR